MGLTPLSRAQSATMATLIEAKRLDTVPADSAAQQFDRLRRARNQDRHEARPVGAAAADKAERVARELFAAAVARGVTP